MRRPAGASRRPRRRRRLRHRGGALAGVRIAIPCAGCVRARASSRAELRLDIVLPAGAVDYQLVRELDLLEPTGPGNPAPVLGLTACVSSGRVRQREDIPNSSWEETGTCWTRWRSGDRISPRHYGGRSNRHRRACGQPSVRGFESIQLEVLDVAAAVLSPRSRPTVPPTVRLRSRAGRLRYDD